MLTCYNIGTHLVTLTGKDLHFLLFVFRQKFVLCKHFYIEDLHRMFKCYMYFILNNTVDNSLIRIYWLYLRTHLTGSITHKPRARRALYVKNVMKQVDMKNSVM